MAGLGEVNVSLGLDTSKAQSQLKSFFGSIGKEPIKDPLKGLDDKFKKTAEQAKKLGFEWDNTTKKFKSDKGFTQTVDQMNSTLKNLGGTTQKSAKDFDNLSKRIKGSADQWKFISGGAQQYQTQLKSLSGDVDKANKALGNLGKTDGLKGVSASADKAATEVKELGLASNTAGNSLKGLGQGSKQGLDSINTSAKGASTSINKLATGSKTLGSAFVNLGKQKPLVPITASLKTLSSTVPPVAAQFTRLGTAVASAGKGTAFSSLAQQLNSVSAPAASAASGVDKLEKEFKEAGAESKTFSQSVTDGFQQILQGIPTGIGIAIGQQLLAPLQALTGIIPGAVAEFRELEESISLTVAIIDGSAAEFNALSDSILKVSSNSAATAAEVGGVAQSLARAGFSLKEIDEALAGVVQGAEATGTSYEAMGQIVVNALGAYQLAASDAGKVSDILTVAANGSNQSVTDLGEALKYVGPIAQATGQSLEDTSLALQLLADSGIKGSQAGTSFRTILTNLQIAASGAGTEFLELSRGSKRLEKALQLIGANMTDANGELITGSALIKELQRSMDGLTSGEKALVSKALAGSEGLPALNTLISASGDKVDELADSLNNSAGAAADATAKALSGLSGSFKLLQSNISAFLVQVGAVIATVLKPLVDVATKALSVFNGLPGPIKSVVVALTLLTAAAAATNVAMVLLQTTTAQAFGAKVTAQIANFTGALTKANIAATISGWGNAISNFASNATGKLITGMNAATEAIKAFSGKAISGASKGVDLLGASLKNVSFKSFTGGIGGMANALKGGFSAALKVAAGGLKGLYVAMAPLLVAAAKLAIVLAPFIAIGAAVAGAFVLIKDKVDAYNKIAEPMEKSQKTLNDSLAKTGKAAKDTGEGFESWGDKLLGFLGPFDDFFEKLIPGYALVKGFLNLLGNVDNWIKQQFQIKAATDAQRKFEEAIAKSNQKIEENRAKLDSGNLSQAEANQLIRENGDLIRAQQEAMEQRIAALDKQIDKLKEEGSKNKDTIQTLERLKGEYIAQSAVIDANAEALKNERLEYDKQNNSVSDYVARLNDAKEARNQIDAQQIAAAYNEELQALNDLNAGLINNEEATARNAQLAVDQADVRIAAENEVLAAAINANDRMLISEEEFEKIKKTTSENIKKMLKGRGEAEQKLADATEAAINRRLQDMQNEISLIEANSQRAATALSAIFAVQGQSISAFKNLANQITTLEITRADQVQQKRIKGIDKEEKRRLKMIDNSSKSDEQKERAKARVQQDAIKQRESAEREFEAKRLAAVSQQIQLEGQMNQANFIAKQAELQLWYTQQQIQLEIQATQAEINRQQAIAAGDDTAAAAYGRQLELIQLQQQQLPKVLQIKKSILQAEKDATTAGLANKAAAEGLSEALAGDVVPTIDEVKQRFLEVQSAGADLADAWTPFQTRASEIPNDVQGVVDQTKAKISTINEVSFASLKENFIKQGNLPQVAEQMASDIVDTYTEASKAAGDAAANNIYERFGETIPKELIKSQLIQAFQDGSQLSLDEAKKKFDELPDLVKKDRIAAAIGAGYGEGAQKGVEVLKNTPLPKGMLAAKQATEEWEKVADSYIEILEQPTFADKAGEAIANWWKGTSKEDTKAAATEAAEGYAEGLESSEQISTAVGDQFTAGAEAGVASAVEVAKASAPEIAAGVGQGISDAFVTVGETIKTQIQEDVKIAGEALNQIGTSYDGSSLAASFNTSLVQPIEKAGQLIGQLGDGSNLSTNFGGVASSVQSISSANLDKTFKSVASDSGRARTATSSLASSTRSAASSANSYARAMERAANAAVKAARARFAGGPVQGGQTYTVNELGKEMFMSNSGNLTEIKAPAFGSWRAPSSGTVIPAGVAQQVRNQRDALSASASGSALKGSASPALSGMGEGPSLTGAIRSGFKGIGGMGTNQIVNNVSVTSDRPVNDASKILTDLARIRAQRRR